MSPGARPARVSTTSGLAWALVLSAIGGWPSSAAADDAAPKKTSALSWARLDGAESCSGAPEIAKRVEAILRRAAIVSPAQADLSIEGRVEKKKTTGFRATIVMAKSSGEILGHRELETDDARCTSLDDSTSLAVALMIDPDAALGPPSPPVDKPKEVPPDPKVVVKETVKTVYVHDTPRNPPAKRPVRFEGYVGGALGLGLTPLSGGFIAGLVIDPPWFGAFELDGSFLIAEKSVPGSATDAGTRFYHATGAAFFCPLAGNVGIVLGSLCAGGEAGFVATSTSGITTTDSAVRPLVNGAARGRIGLWPSPVSVSLGGTLSVPIFRATYTYQNAAGAKTTLFDAAPLAGTFDLSIGFRIPGR